MVSTIGFFPHDRYSLFAFFPFFTVLFSFAFQNDPIVFYYYFFFFFLVV